MISYNLNCKNKERRILENWPEFSMAYKFINHYFLTNERPEILSVVV